MQKFFIDSSLVPLPEIFFFFITLNQPCKTHRPISILQYYIWLLMNLRSTAETVSNSILHIANQHKDYGVKEVSISRVTCTALLNSNLINHVNNALRNKCQTSGDHFIDNDNITLEKLWKDGLHLTNSGKGIIINNLVSL